MAITEQGTLERLRATLYPDGQERARESKTGQALSKVALDDLADYLAEHPTARTPKGKPTYCAKCGRSFSGGEFRVAYAVGWLCRYCYDALALAPIGARCIHCTAVISVDDWRYKLQSVTRDGDGNLKRYFVHSDCEQAMRQMTKAA